MRILFSSLMLILLTLSGARATSWTVGPMLHYNWGKSGRGFSYGLEFAWWTRTDLAKPGYSEKGEDALAGLDLGVELQGEMVRYYSEAQYGLITPSGYTGASVGPFLELGPQTSTGFGLQGSIWNALVLGADMRMRVGTTGTAFSPGLFAKVGMCQTDCEN